MDKEKKVERIALVATRWIHSYKLSNKQPLTGRTKLVTIVNPAVHTEGCNHQLSLKSQAIFIQVYRSFNIIHCFT
jgi:hypothetical protein